MTDIDSLPAGPAMDRLINERVMKLGKDGEILSIGTLTLGSWSPSTNIAHAWEALERLRGNGFRPLVQSNEDGDEYMVNFPSQDEMGGLVWRHGSSRADTAPLAICRAALKAVQ